MKKFIITKGWKDKLPIEFKMKEFTIEHWRDSKTIVFEGEYKGTKATWYVRKANVQFL